MLLFLLFPADIKFWIKCVEVFGIQMFFHGIQPFAETLEMYNLAFSQETDWITDLRVFDKAKDIIICGACFLLCCNPIRTAFY